MITPVKKDDELLAEVAATEPSDGLALWWLGQSGFLLKCAAGHLLFDPYLSDSLTTKYAGTDKPHVRMTEIVVDPARLDFIDVVTSSHNHTDHLDAATILPLINANPALKLVVPEANRQLVAERLGCDLQWPLGADDAEQVDIGGFEIHGVPAAHETVERDAQGHCRFLGYVVRCGRWSVYHAGDTVLFDGMAERLAEFDLDVALLPINGRGADRGVLGNLRGREAAELARQIGAKTVIPCHYEMFEFNTATPDEFVETCETLQQPYRVLRCGERFHTDELTQ